MAPVFSEATATTAYEPIQVVKQCLDAWIAGDIDSMLTHVAEDCVYTLHIDEAALPFAGRQTGKEQIRSALAMMREHFDYILYRPFPAVADGERVRHQVEFIFRHKATGEELSGRSRNVWTVKDGLVTACDEYQDEERLKAFARMTGMARP